MIFQARTVGQQGTKPGRRGVQPGIRWPVAFFNPLFSLRLDYFLDLLIPVDHRQHIPVDVQRGTHVNSTVMSTTGLATKC